MLTISARALSAAPRHAISFDCFCRKALAYPQLSMNLKIWFPPEQPVYNLSKGGLMTNHRDAKKEALLNRLARIQDDIERLSQLDQTPDISDAIAALISEATELEANIAKLQGATSTRGNAKKARALRYKGLSLNEIAATLAISKTSAYRYCADIPVDKRRNAPQRLTKPIWLDTAKSMLHEGKTRHVIAKELGIPLSRFYRAIERFAEG